jgi:hypothetical protein
MTNLVLAIVVAVVLLSAMFIWVPLMQGAEVRGHRYSRKSYEEMPDLREEDDDTQFTGKVY